MDPAVACIASTSQRESQIILQLRFCHIQNQSQIRNCNFKQSPGAFNWEKLIRYDKNKFFLTDIVFFLLASTQTVFFMESMMEHVAKELKLTPEQVRKVNLYQNGQVGLIIIIMVVANKRSEI